MSQLHLRIRPWVPLAAFVFLAAPRLQASGPGLTIVYEGKTTALSAAELSMLAHQEVTAFDFHEKQSHVYSGVPVRDLLAKAGVQFGEKLRGRSLRLAVLAHCRDHYDVVYALAEFDDAFNSRTILLVDRQDGQPLPDALGPFRLVVPGDRRSARWAHMVTSLEVVSVGTSAAD
jgi:DMSO/TMAO reductase YedYZ molybdopterin-dependent catalytic subunit